MNITIIKKHNIILFIGKIERFIDNKKKYRMDNIVIVKK